MARGVCELDENGRLTSITERTKIWRREDGIVYEEENGEEVRILEGTLVSMNLWGFSKGIFKELALRFPAFLNKALRENPLKGEFYIPSVVSGLLGENRASVQVLHSHDQWFGVTYKEDKPFVMEAVREQKASGSYSERLWD